MPACGGQHVGPVAIQDQCAASGKLGQIAVIGIVWNVALEKYDSVSAARESCAQAAPKRRMAVPPRRTDAQSENHQLHRGTSPVSFRHNTTGPHSAALTTLTEAGAISNRCSRSSGIPR